MKEKIKIILICIIGWLFIIQPFLRFTSEMVIDFEMKIKLFGLGYALGDFFSYFTFPYFPLSSTFTGVTPEWSDYANMLISWGIGIILIYLTLRKNIYERKN